MSDMALSDTEKTQEMQETQELRLGPLGSLIGPFIVMGLLAALLLFAGDASVSLRCPG